MTLSFEDAAEILNVHVPFLTVLAERGDLQFEDIGGHQQVRLQTVLAYKRKRDTARSSALGELGEIDGHLL
ncbi:helix-turn-helix domain-containing protein [Novosphingobium arvoryzae]|uniref:Helix-turn-helix domain-containing protein n=1 Tax=Novosphingobium arvoryzae TaxID=1256514 RepID=A0A918RAC0_9SPHN|nr:helix-turn-helix domain-containing protein [Novosphingobium arvoryzae]GGZ89497.1 hypothetical protein GCM10011617_05830 [Novosphingobium arvoryzae]